MKNLYLFSLIFSFCFNSFSQNRLVDQVYDKLGNKYIVGNFEQTLALGSNTLINSNGGTDVFVAKFDKTGSCVWGIKIGGKNSDDVTSIFLEENGNFYVTGYFISEAIFGDKKYKSAPGKSTTTFYLAKYNPSGDPIWVKTSKNTNPDLGSDIASDKLGNLYVAGNFEGQFNIDGQTLKSNGKNDIFLAKIDDSGKCVWMKGVGGKEENSVNNLTFFKNKLLVGGYIESLNGSRLGYISEISAGSGAINWTKNIGTLKGSVEKIIPDITSNYIIAGFIEGNVSGTDYSRAFVAKLNETNGDEVWVKKFNSNQAVVNDLVCDASGNIFFTGSFNDSLILDAVRLFGLESEDIFLAQINSKGKVVWGKSYGHNKIDVGRKLILKNNEIILAGEFTTGLELNKISLSGRESTIFNAVYDIKNASFTSGSIIASYEENYNPNTRLSSISGKLLLGAGNNKSFLNDQIVYIEEENGSVIKQTTTDENGDFSFKNIDVSVPMNLVLEKNDKIKDSDQIFLAQQNGVIIQKLDLDKNNKFQFKLLPAEIAKLEPMEEVDEPVLLLKNFKTSKETQKSITEHILYESGSFQIPSDAVGIIDQIAVFLKQNQSMKIEIKSHTDATGDALENLKLSEKRANEVKNYLIKKQIKAERISIKGLGETTIINRCIDGVNCADKEHSYNRRTEFVFTKGF